MAKRRENTSRNKLSLFLSRFELPDWYSMTSLLAPHFSQGQIRSYHTSYTFSSTSKYSLRNSSLPKCRHPHDTNLYPCALSRGASHSQVLVHDKQNRPDFISILGSHILTCDDDSNDLPTVKARWKAQSNCYVRSKKRLSIIVYFTWNRFLRIKQTLRMVIQLKLTRKPMPPGRIRLSVSSV